MHMKGLSSSLPAVSDATVHALCCRYVPVPPDMRAKEIFCDISKQHLKFGRQGNPPFLDVRHRLQEQPRHILQ
jgi:hypothetical protein